MSIPWLRRLGTRFILSITGFLILLIIIVIALILRGFDQTQQDATLQSQRGLERQGQAALLQRAEDEARLRSAEIELIARSSRTAAQVFSDTLKADNIDPAPLPALEIDINGRRFDPRPQRLTDLVIFPDSGAADPLPEARRSQILDSVFPSLRDKTPNAAAIYYNTPQGVTRYYPVIGLHEVLQPGFRLTTEIFYTVALPADNPERRQVWTPIYYDPAAQGLIITASTPVYAEDELRGVIGVDLQLQALFDSIKMLKPTANGYALLLDQQGGLVVAPSEALPVFFQLPAGQTQGITETLGWPLDVAGTPALLPALEAMRAGQSGVQQLTVRDQALFVAYAPIPNLKWSLVLVAPAAEVTAEAQNVAGAIDRGTSATIRTTLLILGGLALLAMAGIWLLSQRLTRPLLALVAGTRAVAEGRQVVDLPTARHDEFGLLAQSFNQMAGQITSAQQHLQQLNHDLEGTVQQRTHELEQERRSLQQALDELRHMSSTVAGLSTPIIPVLRGVVVVPLIGSLDFERVFQLQTDMLKAVQAQRAHTVILDLTGLTQLDGDTAVVFIACLQSLRLLGAQATLAGVQPELAQQLVLSGIDLHTIETRQNLEAAIQHALRRRR